MAIFFYVLCVVTLAIPVAFAVLGIMWARGSARRLGMACGLMVMSLGVIVIGLMCYWVYMYLWLRDIHGHWTWPGLKLYGATAYGVALIVLGSLAVCTAIKRSKRSQNQPQMHADERG